MLDMRLPLRHLLGPGPVEVRSEPEAAHCVLQPPEGSLLGSPENQTIRNSCDKLPVL